ncbi:MAG: hypothetical protein IJ024_04285 [Lachnospiraceae bacterium]|nr:hypothetical protein [Lachnospiraceae bacterium]
MFGYIVVNKPEMKFREFDLYQSYYCGLCKSLKDRYGKRGQMTLSYDMTFLALLLTSLYESETVSGYRRCVAHPIEKHLYRQNEFTDYAADMNLLLSYEKCLDDWNDEHKTKKRMMAALLKSKNEEVYQRYPEKIDRICACMEQIHELEKNESRNIDEVSGAFGEIMAEIFAYRQDEWEETLRRMGFFFGKFIYLMDAYEDIEADLKQGTYNPLKDIYQRDDFEEQAQQVLLMMMAECSKSYERLPIVENTEILRNILYSGVWSRYDQVKAKRKERSEDIVPRGFS